MSVSKIFDIYAKYILCHLRGSIVAHKYRNHFRVSTARKSKLAEILPVSIPAENSSQGYFIFIAAKQSDVCRSRYIPFSE